MSLNQAMATMMVVTIGQMDNQSIAVVRRAIVLPQYVQGYTTGAAQLACCNNQPVNHVCPKIFPGEDQFSHWSHFFGFSELSEDVQVDIEMSTVKMSRK